VAEVWIVDADEGRVEVWKAGGSDPEVALRVVGWRVGGQRFEIALDEVFRS
jgi:hypothetical protein